MRCEKALLGARVRVANVQHTGAHLRKRVDQRAYALNLGGGLRIVRFRLELDQPALHRPSYAGTALAQYCTVVALEVQSGYPYLP